MHISNLITIIFPEINIKYYYIKLKLLFKTLFYFLINLIHFLLILSFGYFFLFQFLDQFLFISKVIKICIKHSFFCFFSICKWSMFFLILHFLLSNFFSFSALNFFLNFLLFLDLNFLKLFLLVFVFKSCNLSQVFILLIKDFILLCYLFKILYIRYLVHEERLCQLNSIKFTLEQL